MGRGMRMTWGGRKRRWRDLPVGAKRGIGIVASVQFALFATALIDLIRRPSSQVRGGRKWAWLPVLFVNGAGPIAYLTVGRRGAPRGDDHSLRL